MIEFMKKSLYAGVGIAFLTKDKVEELGKTLAEEGKMSKQEGEKFVQEFLSKSEEARANIEQRIRKAVENVVEKMDLPTRNEVNKLNERVCRLEAMITQQNPDN